MKYPFILCLVIFSNTAFCQSADPIVVTTQSINITGSLEVGTWLSEHPNQVYPNYPKLYYGFAEGDEIIIDFLTENKKGTQAIEISEWESKSVVYSNRQFQTLDGIRIKVPKTAVYKFEFGTNHVFDRQAKVTIKRVPQSDVTKNFNCNVTWKTVIDTTFTFVEEKKKTASTYEAVTIQTPVDQFVNSGRNAMFQGGKSRITTQVILPENTVQWYYTFTASREKSDIEGTKTRMRLFNELAGLLDRTGIASLGISALTQPPAVDYCDVYLLKPEQEPAFRNKLDGQWSYISEGTKENLKSGVIQIRNECKGRKYFLGFRNPDSGVGVNVMYEIVAIVEKPVYEVAQVRRPVSVGRRTVAVFGN